MSKIIMGKRTMDIPLIQGGMGVGISLSNLAGNVAKLGGMGTISGVNPGYRSPNFMENPLEENCKALKEEIRKAKEIAKGKGLVAVNLMYAIENYKDMVKAAVEGGADAIVSGAGMPINLPEFAGEDILLAPIVSSKRALRIIHKAWTQRYNRFMDFVVVEGPLAGGHLGFKEKDLEKADLNQILMEVVEWVEDLEKETGHRIPIFAAGGIRSSERRHELMKLGADGIQVGTPFIVTEECDADIAFKETVRMAKEEDLEIIKSPVGMPARAIRNEFIQDLEEEKLRKKTCVKCLKTCEPATSPYCIARALGQSAKGKKGLVFSGANIEDLNEIVRVKDVVGKLMEEV